MNTMLFAAIAAVTVKSEWSPALFWWWNSKLDEKQLCAQVDDFYEHGSRTLCIHPFPKGFRPARFPSMMEPDYLTPEYMDIYRKVTDHAAAKGMTCWLYDEGGWPSGGACNQVYDSNPEAFAMRWMRLVKGRPEVCVGTCDKTEASANPSIIEPGATEKFLELTHEKYAAAIGRHFGKAVPWVFTDEPAIPHGWRYPWTTDFADVFRARKGYDLVPLLPKMLSTTDDSEEAKRARIDFWDEMSGLYLRRFLLPCRDWCRAHGLAFGGHADGDDSMACVVTHGHCHLLRALRAMDMPGVDVIWRQIHPDADYTALPRYASSAAHQTGAKRVLSESFAIYGETITPDIVKRTVDFQLVRGVNAFVFAFSSATTARNFMNIGEPHWGKCNPKWAFVKPFFDYVAESCERLGTATNPVEVAVYYDVKPVWATSFLKGETEGTRAVAAQVRVAQALDRMQVDFDFVDDDLVEAGRLPYKAIVLPTCGRLSERAKAALERFRANGGITVGPDELEKVPRTVRATGENVGNLRVTKRLRDDGSVDYFFVNESREPISAELVFVEGAKGALPLAGYESRFVRLGKDGKTADLDPPPPIADQKYLDGPWKMRKVWSVRPGEDDFVYDETPAADWTAGRLGDWSFAYGTNFSGRVTYRVRFSAAAGKATLDLGKVRDSAAARLNGVDLGARFCGPFRWEAELKDGENVLEVTVANSLAPALLPELPRIYKAFSRKPSSWSVREWEFYRKDEIASGLFGPVKLEFPAPARRFAPWAAYRPGSMPQAVRARLSREAPAAFARARKNVPAVRQRFAEAFRGNESAFQFRRAMGRLELCQEAVKLAERQFGRGMESDFGYVERALDDLAGFESYFDEELLLWEKYPLNPRVNPRRFTVRDFGAKGDGKTDDAVAFEKALKAVRALNGEPAVLEVGEGVYLFGKRNGKAALEIRGLTNFVMRGVSPDKVRFVNGVYDNGTVALLDCCNVTVSGFENGYAKCPYFQGEVLEVNQQEGWIEAKMTPGTLAPTDPAWTDHFAQIRGSQYGRDGRIDHDCLNCAFEGDAEDIGGGVYRIRFGTRVAKGRWGTLRKGMLFAMPNRDNRYSAMIASGGAFVNFERVRVRAARAAAFGVGSNRYCSVVDCEDVPERGRLMSSNADSCIARTGLHLDGCRFDGMGDDGVNTLTRGGYVCSRSGKNSIVQFNGTQVRPGVFVQFIDSKTGEYLGNARVTAVTRKDWRKRPACEVTLDREIPAGVVSYDDLGTGPLDANSEAQATIGLVKIDATPTHFYFPNACGVGSVVTRTHFSRTRCAGLVLQNSNTLVEGCTVDNVKTGLRVNCLGSFIEGTPPVNVIVRDSSFTDIGEEGAMFFQSVRNGLAKVASIRGVRVSGCRFEKVRKLPFNLTTISDSWFSGNTFDGGKVPYRFGPCVERIATDADQP